MVVDARNAVTAFSRVCMTLALPLFVSLAKARYTAVPLRYSGYSKIPGARTGIAKVAYSTSVEP